MKFGTWINTRRVALTANILKNDKQGENIFFLLVLYMGTGSVNGHTMYALNGDINKFLQVKKRILGGGRYALKL